MTKQDLVEVAIKLPSIYYGFKLATSLIIYPLQLLLEKNHPSLYPTIGLLIPFTISIIMVLKSELIIGWLFKKENNSEPVE